MHAVGKRAQPSRQREPFVERVQYELFGHRRAIHQRGATDAEFWTSQIV